MNPNGIFSNIKDEFYWMWKKGGISVNWLRKAIKPMDLLIGAIGLYLFLFSIDYQAMTLIDKVYVVCFVIWAVLLIVRCYVYWKGKR